ncbi:MAG: DUF4279 domain-containing protein [Saccharofermentanales bacterium]
MHISGYIYLRISGESLDFDEISKMLNILPKNAYKKGDRKVLDNSEEITYKEDCWLAEYGISAKTEISLAINGFLSQFQKGHDYLRDISKRNEITLWISVYPNDIQANIHFPNHIVKMISDIGIDMDISMTYLEDFYAGKI